MTRKKQINKAAEQFLADRPKGYFRTKSEENTAHTGFITGAKWADEHPKSPWISVNERLPEITYPSIGESDFVFVHVINKSTGAEWIELTAKYNERFHDWQANDFTWIGKRNGVVTHWIQIPQIEKGE